MSVKKITLTIVLVVCVLIATMLTSCNNNKTSPNDDGNDSSDIKSLEYTLNEDENYYIVSGIGNYDEENIVIPAEYNSLPVKAIDANAFENCDGIKSVVVSDSVTHIGEFAFKNCSNLTSLIVSNSVTSIGESILNGCSSIESLTLPFIGSDASNTKSDKNTLFGYIFGTVSFQGSIATVQYYGYEKTATFFIPSSLKDVIILGGNVLYGAFYNCENIENISIGSSVEKIESCAFYNCSNLKEFNIPSSVTSIGSNAFYKCAFKSISIPENVAYIGGSAFSGCLNLESIYYNAKECQSFSYHGAPFSLTGSSEKGIVVTVGNKVKTIPQCFLCSGSNENNIISVVFEEQSVCAEIGFEAFLGCKKLSNIVLPETIIHIDSYAFNNCSFINISLPSNLQSIGNDPFQGNPNLEYNQYDNAYYLGNESNPYLLLIEAVNTDIMSCEIYNGTKVINTDAFRGCKNITELIIPDSVIDIDGYAFSHCTSLISVKLPVHITDIYSLFDGCTQLKSITIPEGVTSLGTHAFMNCSNLEYIVLPDTIEKMWGWVFSGCEKLMVYYQGTIEQWTKIEISDTNTILSTTEKVCFYSEEAPTDSEYNYWHFVDGVPTIW